MALLLMRTQRFLARQQVEISLETPYRNLGFEEGSKKEIMRDLEREISKFQPS
jgi:hypothetical protein